MVRLLAPGFLISVIVSLAATAVARQDDRATKAEAIVNIACTSCHDLRKIQTQALDEESWSGVVNSMVERGAPVDKEDIPLMVSYLVENFGPLPEGDGKQIVLNKCTVCHDLKRVRRHFATPEDWAETLGAMENEGLIITSEEFASVLRYLARNFRQ
jgi:cytochrome c5